MGKLLPEAVAITLVAIACTQVGCSYVGRPTQGDAPIRVTSMAQFEKSLGQRVLIEGRIVNGKLGILFLAPWMAKQGPWLFIPAEESFAPEDWPREMIGRRIAMIGRLTRTPPYTIPQSDIVPYTQNPREAGDYPGDYVLREIWFHFLDDKYHTAPRE